MYPNVTIIKFIEKIKKRKGRKKNYVNNTTCRLGVQNPIFFRASNIRTTAKAKIATGHKEGLPSIGGKFN